MNKLEILLENHKDDVLSFIDKLYSEKYPKKKSSKRSKYDLFFDI